MEASSTTSAFTATVSLAARGGGLSGSTWGIIVAGITAAAAILTLVLRERQRRREDVDQKVAAAVDARLGRTLLEFREFESGVRSSLEATASNAAAIELQLKERLDVSETHSTRLGELLDKASGLLPRLEAARPVLPRLLVLGALRAQSPEEGLAVLSALLSEGEATPSDLAAGGNIAGQRFGADRLSLALHERALELNPALVASRASVLLLQTDLGILTVDEGRQALSALAKEHADDRNVLSEALNLYSHFDDYAGMLSFVDEMLSINDRQAILWRNRAISLVRLGKADEGERAYARSYEIAHANNDSDERTNTTRPYARFLLDAGKLEDARRILETSLAGDPDEPDLLRLLGAYWELAGDDEKATLCYQAGLETPANPSEKAALEQRFAALTARESLAEKGLLPSDPRRPSGRAGSSHQPIRFAPGSSTTSDHLEPGGSAQEASEAIAAKASLSPEDA